jgi:hypothetical protein
VRFGLDLDNTLIDYEAAFCAAAAEIGVVPAGARLGKTEVRDRIRALPDGERTWMGVQAMVYGPGIGAARLYDGVEAFIAAARARGIALVIVSHKSEFAAAAPAGPSLRACARAFLADRGIDLPVHFESTRAEKCARLGALGVTHAIDDLVEVFADPAFPAGVRRWLFAPAGGGEDAPVDGRFASWDALRAALPG